VKAAAFDAQIQFAGRAAPGGIHHEHIRRLRNEAIWTVDPLATYKGSLQCWNWSSLRESGGVPSARLAVCPGHLEMTTNGVFKLFFRPRTIAKERVRLIRLLLLRNPAHRVILAAHPLGRGREFINLVVSAPAGERTGNIHYVLGVRAPSAAQVLDFFEDTGFPVSRDPLRLTQFNIAGQLNWPDFLNRPGHR
jgi:hypothetical protein